VTLGYLAAERWMQAVNENKIPRELEISLLRKRARLQALIKAEESMFFGIPEELVTMVPPFLTRMDSNPL